MAEVERTMFRPSRTNYPGSRFGGKSRYDLPQRHKAYGNADEVEAILFSGTSLQPQVWGTSGGTAGPIATGLVPSSEQRGRGASNGGESTPRAVLSDAGRSLLAERQLPELPLINERNDVHGVVVLGGKHSGKTSLVLSLQALVQGEYPNTHMAEYAHKIKDMQAYGNSWELPEREVRYASGETREMRIVLTDTPPCGTKSQEEQPLCVGVSPNSTQHYNAIPSWMRITLRSGNLPHYAVLFVIDASATPLWEDHHRCRELARLLAVLKRNQYTVVIAVTKLHHVRENRLRDTAYGVDHKNEVGKDPRSSYESFVSRYIDKVCACIQAKAGDNDWAFSQAPDAPAFPQPNVTIFDVPTWTGSGEHKEWSKRKGTPELPNFKYANSQLQRLLHAVCRRSNAE
eukprot:TRINITY_DN94179_c0_g1_i1.p1 TRINITY_DN94179_c0_g1~~TRINITY_DN94179_c0_g1_i1.p1  ORF type:complete len:401 (-),score=59.16 TRINITY_DN94179_c0_g1_i1:50-1252(-)